MTVFPFLKISNRLLRALPEDELYSLNGSFEPIEVSCGEILYYPGELTEYVYFPENCVIALMTEFENGDLVERGSIGPEGVVGGDLYLSKKNSSNRLAQVQAGGRCLRMKAAAFLAFLAPDNIFRQLIGEYQFVFMEQALQIAACQCHHSLKERIARILLLNSDLIGSFSLQITHEVISQMLGAQRPSVSAIAAGLKREKMIGYMRGRMSIIDRRRLENEACECYDILRAAHRLYESYLTAIGHHSGSLAHHG